MVLKAVRAKTEAAWTTTKKLLALMSCWGLIFSVVTIAKLGVAFEYDDTLVFSTPAFAKAFASVQQAYSPQFWSVVNKSYDVEKPKYLSGALAWTFRLFGFKVAIVAARPSTDGEALKKEWRRLTPKTSFYFAGDKSDLKSILERGNFVLFFSDNDSDILEARKAGVYCLRVKRSSKSMDKEDYHPGTLGELVLPGSQY
jgi:acid phosphatase class B